MPSLSTLTYSYWANAQTSRHPSPAIAAPAEAHLWRMAQSSGVPERLRNAALRQIGVKRQGDQFYEEVG